MPNAPVRVPLASAELEMRRYFARLGHTNWLANEMSEVLGEAFGEARSRLTSQRWSNRPNDRARLAALTRDIDDIMRQTYDDARATMQQRLAFVHRVERLSYEKEFGSLAGTLGGGVTAATAASSLLTRNQALAIAELPLAGFDFGRWWMREAGAMSERIRREIQVGLTLGEGPREIAKRIMPTRGGVDAATPSIYRVARRNAEIFTRTSMTAVSNEAAAQSFRDLGPEIVDRVQYAAVLDHRTTKVCRALDGRVWRLDDPDLKQPPLHINCRSTLLPVISASARRALGLRADSLTTERTERSYATWLTDQSPAKRVAILGKDGAKRFANGETLESIAAADIRRLSPNAYALALDVHEATVAAPATSFRHDVSTGVTFDAAPDAPAFTRATPIFDPLAERTVTLPGAVARRLGFDRPEFGELIAQNGGRVEVYESGRVAITAANGNLDRSVARRIAADLAHDESLNPAQRRMLKRELANIDKVLVRQTAAPATTEASAPLRTLTVEATGTKPRVRFADTLSEARLNEQIPAGIFKGRTYRDVLVEHVQGIDGTRFAIRNARISGSGWSDNGIAFRFQIEDVRTGELVGTVSRVINGDVVDHSLFAIEKKYEGQGFAKRYLRDAMKQYEAHDVSRVDVHANIDIGGRAWARYGFVPNQTSWGTLLGELRQTYGSDARSPGPIGQFLAKLDIGDPYDIWKIADSEWGKELLHNTHWYGSISLTNKRQMERWNWYVNLTR